MKGKFGYVRAGQEVIVRFPSVQVGMPDWYRKGIVISIDETKLRIRLTDDRLGNIRTYLISNGQHTTRNPEMGWLVRPKTSGSDLLAAFVRWLKREKIVSAVRQVWETDRNGNTEGLALTLDRGVRVRMVKRIDRKISRKKAGIFLVLTGENPGKYFRSPFDDM